MSCRRSLSSYLRATAIPGTIFYRLRWIAAVKYLLQLAQESVVLQFCSLLSRLRPCTYIFRWSTVGRLNHRAAVNSRYFRSTYVKATTWPSSDKVVYHGTAYSPHCADAFLNVSFSGLYRTGVWRLRPAIVRRQRTLCGIRIKSFGTLFVSAPLCGDSDLCDPDRNQSAVVGCLDVWVLSSFFSMKTMKET